MSKRETLYGIHTLAAVLKHSPERLIELFIQKGQAEEGLEQIIKKARQLSVPVQFCHKKTLDERAKGENHQGVLAIVTAMPTWQEADLFQLVEQKQGKALFLVLDQVTDPHNLGACLRTADAAGVDAVIVPKDKSTKLTPVVKKVASGAAEVIPLVVVTNLARTLRELKEQGVWVIGTAGETSQSLYETKFTGALALVMGAEGTGMRRLTREICDELVAIPLQGTVSSLNVSVAAGVCLFEVVRQRQALA